MFADDIALLAEHCDLHKMMDTLDFWCKKWKMVIHEKKNQVMHFQASYIKARNTSSHVTVPKYKYILGISF